MENNFENNIEQNFLTEVSTNFGNSEDIKKLHEIITNGKIK